jgi:hypothetical protein
MVGADGVVADGERLIEATAPAIDP